MGPDASPAPFVQAEPAVKGPAFSTVGKVKICLAGRFRETPSISALFQVRLHLVYKRKGLQVFEYISSSF